MYPILRNPEIQRVVLDRGIRPEHFGLLQELAGVPNNLIIERLHNFFSTGLSKQDMLRDLERHLQRSREGSKPESEQMYRLVIALLNAYDIHAAWNLVMKYESSALKR